MPLTTMKTETKTYTIDTTGYIMFVYTPTPIHSPSHNNPGPA